MSPKNRRLLGFAVILLVLGVLAVPKIISMSHESEDAAAPASAGEAEKPPLVVATRLVAPESLIERLSTTGTVRANEQVEIVGETAGKVVEIFFDEGARVEVGQVLVKIDDVTLQAERERIVYRLKLAERREDRQKELSEEGVISAEEYEVALNELNVLQAELALLEVRIEKTEVRAPFTGVIGLRYVSLGSYLTPQDRIASLQDIDPVKIDFAVPERYARQIRPGTEVSFRVSGVDRLFEAEVYAIEPSIDAETRSLSLRAQSANPDGLLLPGAFADVEVVIREVEDALTVPNLAVIPELGGKKVFVLEDGHATPRRVETGLRSAEKIEILSGLEPGDRVIVSAIQQLEAGLAVTASDAAETEGSSGAEGL